MYEQPKPPLKKILIRLVIGLVILLGVYWVWSTSFVKISINGSISGEYTYQFVNQRTGKLTEVKSRVATLKKRLPRGSYTVLVKQNNLNYFSVVKPGGLLKTITVSARMSKEKSRRFVGDNPGSCMAYVRNILASYTCTDLFENINLHQPANASTPTYVIKNPDISGSNGYVQGIIQAAQGDIALVKVLADSDADGGYQILHLTTNLRVNSKVSASNLDLNTTYSINPYQTGFIIYNQSLTSGFYYSSISAQPQPISLDGSNNDLAPSFLTTNNNQILTAFTANSDSKLKGIGSEIVIKDNAVNAHYIFNKIFTSAVLCSKQILCGVDSNGLQVYSLANKKPKLLYGIRDASLVVNSSKGTLVVTGAGVLRLDVSSRSGFLEYSFDNYKFNNAQMGIDNYVLSLTNPQGKKVGLYVDQNTEDTDQIDKKMLSLQKLPEVSSSSIYGRYIFITPNIGSLVFNSNLGSYDADPVAKANVNAKISLAIDQIGIDKKVYKIINTAK